MKSKYKDIGIEHFPERKNIALTFQGKNYTDAKWLTYEEAKELIKKLQDVLKEIK